MLKHIYPLYFFFQNPDFFTCIADNDIIGSCRQTAQRDTCQQLMIIQTAMKEKTLVFALFCVNKT